MKTVEENCGEEYKTYPIVDGRTGKIVFNCDFEVSERETQVEIGTKMVSANKISSYVVVDSANGIGFDLIEEFCPLDYEILMVMGDVLEKEMQVMGINMNSQKKILIKEGLDASNIFVLLHEISHAFQKYDPLFCRLKINEGPADMVSLLDQLRQVIGDLEFEKLPELEFREVLKLTQPFWKEFDTGTSSPETRERAIKNILKLEIGKGITIEDLIFYVYWRTERDVNKGVLLMLRKIKREFGMDLLRYTLTHSEIMRRWCLVEIAKRKKSPKNGQDWEFLSKSERELNDTGNLETHPWKEIKEHLNRIGAVEKSMRRIGRVRLKTRQKWNDFEVR